MARKRYRPEEIVWKLRRVEAVRSQGMPMEDATRRIGGSEVTYYRWRKEYGGMPYVGFATVFGRRFRERQMTVSCRCGHGAYPLRI